MRLASGLECVDAFRGCEATTRWPVGVRWVSPHLRCPRLALQPQLLSTHGLRQGKPLGRRYLPVARARQKGSRDAQPEICRCLLRRRDAVHRSIRARAGCRQAARPEESQERRKEAGKRQGTCRYEFDTFTVDVRACKRLARFKVSCQAAIRGVASCLENKCAPLGPGLYKETCRWTSLVTAYGKGHRQLRTSETGFKCELGDALPDDG